MVSVTFSILAAISLVGIAAALSAGSVTVTLLCIFCLGASGLWWFATSKIK